MTKMTLREASRLITRQSSAMTKGTAGYQFEAAELQTRNVTPVLEAEIAAVRAVSELLRAQLTDTRKECERWRQKAARLALQPPAPAPVPEPLRHRRWWQPA
jgi:hypothetical protein